jgi:hypothetical protein
MDHPLIDNIVILGEHLLKCAFVDSILILNFFHHVAHIFLQQQTDTLRLNGVKNRLVQ